MTAIEQLRNRFLDIDYELQTGRRNLAREEELLNRAEEDLRKRRGELLGDPNRPDVLEHPELTVGVVKANIDAEEDRNDRQFRVDYLLREIKAGVDLQQDVTEDNRQRTTTLPPPRVPGVATRPGED